MHTLLFPILFMVMVMIPMPLFGGSEQPILKESDFATGFRGIAWGTHKDQLPDLGLSKKALKNIYAEGYASAMFMEGKGNLDLNFEEVPLLSIFLNFNNQQLYGADMVFDPEHRQKVSAMLTQQMGTSPTMAEDQTSQWKENQVTVLLTDREIIITHEAYQ